MSNAKITLYGVIDYFESIESSLFDNLVVPSNIDVETLENTIILKGGEFEALYSNPDFFKSAIGSWSLKNNRTFEKWSETLLNVEYSPIENYDRIEDTTDHSIGAGTTNSIDKISAFNSDLMQNDSQSDGNTNFNNQNTRTSRIHGNIGVTTNQQMLESEIKLRSAYNIYDMIADLFISEFCIQIY